MINKKIHNAVSEMEAPKVGIKGVLAGHTVTMVSHCVKKMITTHSPMIGTFLIP